MTDILVNSTFFKRWLIDNTAAKGSKISITRADSFEFELEIIQMDGEQQQQRFEVRTKQLRYKQVISDNMVKILAKRDKVKRQAIRE